MEQIESEYVACVQSDHAGESRALLNLPNIFLYVAASDTFTVAQKEMFFEESRRRYEAAQRVGLVFGNEDNGNIGLAQNVMNPNSFFAFLEKCADQNGNGVAHKLFASNKISKKLIGMMPLYIPNQHFLLPIFTGTRLTGDLYRHAYEHTRAQILEHWMNGGDAAVEFLLLASWYNILNKLGANRTKSSRGYGEHNRGGFFTDRLFGSRLTDAHSAGCDRGNLPARFRDAAMFEVLFEGRTLRLTDGTRIGPMKTMAKSIHDLLAVIVSS